MSLSVVKIKGAGLKGLALAYFLKQRGIPSIIYEKSSRAGGWIKTIRQEGFIFEAGPRGFRPHPRTLELIESLGLTSQLIRPDKASRKRFIYYNQKLRPLSYFSLAIIKGLIKDVFAPASKKGLSIHDYFLERLGPFCTYHLIDPLVSGIYAGDIKKLSANKCFPLFTSRGKLLKSILSSPSQLKNSPYKKEPLLSFKGGFETLIEALMKDQPIVYDRCEEEVDFDCSPDNFVNYSSVVAVNIGWKEGPKLPKGFGYLIPQNQNEKILGVVFDSQTFPDQNFLKEEVRLTIMMGGVHHPQLIKSSDEEIKNICEEALKIHLGIVKKPDIILIHRALNAIPQPGLTDSFMGVGVNDAIEKAFQFSYACKIKS